MAKIKPTVQFNKSNVVTFIFVIVLIGSVLYWLHQSGIDPKSFVEAAIGIFIGVAIILFFFGFVSHPKVIRFWRGTPLSILNWSYDAWDIELECPKCHCRDIPNYKGWAWRPLSFGGRSPTVMAKLVCQKCGQDLNQQARTKLVELFSDVQISNENKALAFLPLISFIGIVIVGAWLIVRGFGVFGVLFVALMSVVCGGYFVRREWNLFEVCSCGKQNYRLLGYLGLSSYCFKCFACRKLFRVRAIVGEIPFYG